MLRQQVYYIGIRYQHHARHSGYEAYSRYVGTILPSPVKFRWTFKGIINVLSQHPWYSVGSFLTELAALQHMIRRRGCLYHVLYGESDLLLLRNANRLTGNRIVASFHQPASHLQASGIVEKITKNIDAVVLVSESIRTYFENFLPPERIFVVPHGVDTHFFCPPEKVTEQPVCITVGAHLRDFETLKQAINLVWQKNPNVRFIAVGTQRNSDKNYLEGIEDERIQFLDKVSDEELIQAYQSAKISIFSFNEATANNAMLEAMACGLPMVATDIGGVREYVDETTGVLCPPKNPQAFAEAIIRLLGDSDCIQSMAIATRKRALEWDYKIIADKMAQMYSKILDFPI